MSTVYIYRGLPGSGKTSWAKETIKESGGRLVGRDHLRPLFGITEGIGPKALEDKVTKEQGKLIREGIRLGQDVHVDDLNLRSKYVTRLIKIALEEGAEWLVRDLTGVLPAVCVMQDKERDRQVGEEVIMDLYNRFLPLPPVREPDPKDIVPSGIYQWPTDGWLTWIVDIDGTVAKMNGRGPHEYHRVDEDLPNTAVISVVRALQRAGYQIVFVSGRPDSCEEATRMWLTKHVITNFHLVMRKAGDYRDDSIVKRELFDTFIRTEMAVMGVLDDRNRVVDMWRGLGLTCLQVDEGDF